MAQPVWSIPQRDRDLQMDGHLTEWEGVAGLQLSPSADDLHSAGEFTGPEDLTLEVRALWDDDYLYFALDWSDDVWDIEEVSRRDAVWIDSENRRRDRMLFFDYLKLHIRQSDYDYTLWTSPRAKDQGPFFWSRLLEGYRGIERASAAPMITCREGERRVTCEILLIWKQLKLKPDDKEPIPLTLIVADSDDPDRLLEFKVDRLKWIAWQGSLNPLEE